ncbi:MAG TPA: hypothetical protein VGO68_13785 [Pyrinomonadaceae bacterium]|jgi:hypothetical protein|nr:hypothetical protein [Pyrinomonadaceae bacterium]
MKLVLAIALLLSLQTISVQAQNWPGFRGPNAAGIADHIYAIGEVSTQASSRT